MTNIVDQLINHEGLKLKPYRCPAGKLTIGVGRNIEQLGITREEAIYLLKNDIKRVESELSQFDWYSRLNQARKNAIIDMCFNLGISRFKGFRRMIAALYEDDYKTASDEMLDSHWAIEVGQRAITLSDMMRKGY